MPVLENIVAPQAVEVLLIDEGEGEHAVPSEHRYRTAWRVAMNLDTATAFDVLKVLAPLPQPGESFRQYDWELDENDRWHYVAGEILDEYAVVVLRVARRDPNNPHWWIVQVSYEGSTDPTAEPAEVDYQDIPYQEYVTQDIHGAMVANSALDFFEGGVPVDRSRTSLVIVRNVPYDGWDPELAERFKNTTNLKPFNHGDLTTFGLPIQAAPGTVKIGGITAKRMLRARGATPEEAKFYWQVRTQVDFDNGTWKRPDGVVEPTRWRRIVLDAGYRKLREGGRTTITTTAQKPTHPPLLDGRGGPLPEPSDKMPATPAPIVNPTVTPRVGIFGVGGSSLNIPAPGILALAPGAQTAQANSGRNPTKGTVTVNADGSFTYTVNTGQTGWDQFGYYAQHPDETTAAEGTVLVLIGPQPVFLAIDVYRPVDWSPIAHFLEW